MSGAKTMILRVQSAEGTSRVEAVADEATAQLYERVFTVLGLSSYGFALHKDRGRREEIVSSKSRRLQDYNLKHGDMIYLSPVNGAVLFEQPATGVEMTNKPSTSTSNQGVLASSSKSSLGPSPAHTPSHTGASVAPQEDDVDIELYKESGSIQRQRDEKLCRHNANGCCVHCSPIEPWDENYLKEQNIKHMSFHAYLRKMQSKNFISLNELSFKIKPGCTEHPPWPRGICSKCQPGAVTLARQPYRHVDNVLVENPALVERFLSYWRVTGHQRLGILYGKVEKHPLVPLGVRARVAAIYEPPQHSGRDSLALQPDPREPLMEAIAQRLGLRQVGWIFTDLLPLDSSAGTVKQIRGVDTHFLSAQECIMAGHYQNMHPNACRHSASGYYGSKFVTVCVTGDSSAQVHLEGYQVSEQAAALVRDGVLLPTRDAPELAAVRPSTDAQYVPDVYYKERDAYGNEVSVRATQLPVAYLLVDVPCGVAASGAPPTLHPGGTFPPAHRPLHHHLQTLAALHDHVSRAGTFLEAMSDLHVLLYLCTNEALPLTIEQLEPLLEAVRTRDEAGADSWRAEPHFATLEHLARAASEHDAPSASEGGSGAAGGGVWTCQLCTFHNAAQHDSCEMCAMPRTASAM